MRSLILLVVALVSAGCLEGEAANESEPASVSGKRTMSEPFEPPRWANITVFEETIEYSRTDPQGETRQFVVPAGSRSSTLYWAAVIECPVSLDDSASFTASNGEASTKMFLLPPRNGGLAPDVGPDPFICLGQMPPRTGSHQMANQSLPLVPVKGEWKLDTAGVCTCAVAFRVEAEVPA